MEFLTLNQVMTLDGLLFVLIGIVVLLAPSPQPGLVTPVSDSVLPPFKDTRRLLASQFIAVGLMLFTLGWFVHDLPILRIAAILRITTLLLVISINLSQLRQGYWKPRPLYFLIGLFTVMALVYTLLILRG